MWIFYWQYVFLNRTVLWGGFHPSGRTDSNSRHTHFHVRADFHHCFIGTSASVDRSVIYCDRGVARALFFPPLSRKIKAWRGKNFIPVTSSHSVQILYFWNARRVSADFTSPLRGMLTALLLRQDCILPWGMRVEVLVTSFHLKGA
jgi:hypothetical protein